MGLAASHACESNVSYQHRRPEATALYEVVRDNLETLYGAIDERRPRHEGQNPAPRRARSPSGSERRRTCGSIHIYTSSSLTAAITRRAMRLRGKISAGSKRARSARC
jgi:hypothetical protein